jgi:putative tricarboxylic transport membrane protein
MLEYIAQGFDITLLPVNLLAIVLGVIIGLIFGAIPGLSGVTAVSLLIPFTYGMPPVTGLLIMIGVYCAATYGGSISAILFNIPGDVMGAATAIDGYPMSKKGEANQALAMAIFASLCGGIFGTIMLGLVAPQFIKIALTFGSPEYFALAFLGLTVVSSLGTKSQSKALIAVLFGLWLSTIGLDPVFGVSRFTMGNPMLQAGISLVPAIIGFFALSEVFFRMYDKNINIPTDMGAIKQAKAFSLPSRKDIKDSAVTIFRSSVIGNFVGILPGAGATIAAFLGYGTAVRFSKEPKKFGQGTLEGVAAPESANNAAVGGAMVPLLTLGIPGSASTAIMLAVFLLHGLQPGPLMFQRMPDMIYALITGMFIANIFMFIFAIMAIRILVRFLLIKFEFLSLYILVLCVFGAFSIHDRFVDVWVMFVCGILGFFAKKYEYPIAAIILGIVLGGIAESGFVNGILIVHGSFIDFFTRPITLGILIASSLFFTIPLLDDLLQRRKHRQQEQLES